MGFFMSRNLTKIGNEVIRDTIYDDIDRLLKTVSEERDFTYEGQELLHWSLCDVPDVYVSFASTILPCDEIYSGAVMRGLSSTIAEMYLYAQTFVAKVDTFANYLVGILALADNKYFSTVVVVNEHIRRAVKYLNRQ